MTTVIAANVTIPSGTLDLMNGGFNVAEAGFTPGQVTHTITSAKSIWVDGEQPTSIVKQNSKGTLKLLLESDTHAGIGALLSQLYAAFDQFSYVLSITLDGYEYAWKGFRADYDVGFVRQFVHSHICPVSVLYNRYPIPVAGPV